MYRRAYRRFLKPVTERAGLHPHLRALHDRVLPSTYVAMHDRAALRERAETCYEFSTAETVEIPVLAGVPDSPDGPLSVAGTYRFDRPFVAELRGGRVLDRLGVCATAGYTLLLDSASSRETRVRGFLKNNQRYAARLLARQHRPQTIDSYDLDTAVSFVRTPTRTGARKDGYAHWVQSYLTRIEGVTHYRERTGRKPTVIVERDAPSWMLESLALLGYGEDDIAFWDSDEELRVRRLVVPSIRRVEHRQGDTGFGYKVLSREACEWLRDAAVNRVAVDRDRFSSKVFVSRADADRRRIANRTEVLDTLRERGFESYELTTLSVPEQVALFAQADEVVGVHGAGLTNIMFASDCAVTEITGDVFKPTYFLMAEVLGHEYRLVVGQNIDADGVSPLHQDIQLDPAEL